MRITYFFIFIVLITLKGYNQNILKPEWKFKTGDNIDWAQTGFDDSSWEKIKIGELWEMQGHQGYDGYAWYRAVVFIPASLKADAEKNAGLLLRLGRIDDVDFTYFNGDLLGKTGEIPPNFVTKYNMDRVYPIPADKIKWNSNNIIAVRVYDHSGGGGIYHFPIDLAVKGFSEKFEVKVLFKEQDRIIKNSTNISFPVIVQNGLKAGYNGILEVIINTDKNETVLSKKEKLSVGKETHKEITFKIGDLKPGFYNGTIVFDSPGNYSKSLFKFGVEPEKIISPIDANPDFENYWDRAKKELAAVDPQYKLIKIDSLCTQTKDYYLVEMRSLGNVLIRGWYSAPKKQGSYPAILHVQGYSSNIIPSFIEASDEFVSFGLNIRGHGNSCDNINPGFPGYLTYSLNDKEMYIYRGAYMDCRRAVDFLYSRPEVDKSKVIVEGGSQGGALSFATAALNNDRVWLCIPHVPFLSDFKDYFALTAWPGNEFYQYVSEHPEIGWNKVYETLSYVDIKNLAPWIKAPVLMGVGLIDDVCPPHINFAAFNNLNVPKEYIVYPNSGHNIPSDFHQKKMEWIRAKLKDNK